MTTTTTTTTTSTVMPVNPSNTLTQGISPSHLNSLDAQTHSVASAAIPQAEISKSLGCEVQDLTTQCSWFMPDIPQDLIGLFFEQCWSNNDFTDFLALACTNHYFYTNISTIVEKIDLKKLCPLLQIVSATQARECGFQALPASVLPKLSVMKAYQAMSPHVEGDAGVTYLDFSLPDGITLREIVEIARNQGITIHFSWTEILTEIGDVAIAQVFPCMLANNIFKDSRNKNFDDQLVLMMEHGCKLPTVEQYIMHIVLIQKISNQCLFGVSPLTYGRTITICQDLALVIGSSSRGSLFASGSSDDCEYESVGAGGSRKF